MTIHPILDGPNRLTVWAIVALSAVASTSSNTSPLTAGDVTQNRRRRHGRHGGAGGDDGQATAEYALVLLGAAAVALAVISWATRTNLIGKLLDTVFGGLLGRAG